MVVAWPCLKAQRGYTLLELMIVVAIAGILVTLAVPTFQTSALKAKEAALKHDLFTLRSVLDQYYTDRGQYPPSLEELVTEGYLRVIPPDPLTKSATTWQEIFEDESDDPDKPPGVFDVHSGSDLVSLNGTPYNEW